MSLQVEESVDYPTLLRLNSDGRIDDIRWGPAYSAGTRVWVRVGEIWHAYLVTDLTAAERRVGSVSVNILANAFSGNASVSLVPPLDSTANYKAFASANDADVAWSGRAYLLNVNTMIVSAFRSPVPTATGSAVTNLTVAGNDLLDVFVQPPGGAEPHGSDLGIGPHNHTLTGHPVTDPGHLHAITLAGGAIAVNVDWLLWHT